MTPEFIARAMLLDLIGDEEWQVPNIGSAYLYFKALEPEESLAAWRQIKQLNEGERMGDIAYRMRLVMAGLE